MIIIKENYDLFGVVLVLAAVTGTLFVAEAVDTSQCISPLGMENGFIKDEDIRASSSFDSSNVGPHHGRLKNEKNGGAWCPKLQATTEPQEWIEIDLHTAHLITGAATQGRFGNGQGVEFAEAYVLEYWRPRLGKWVRYRDSRGEEVISGNINTYLESKTELDPPVWATKVRFMPYSFHRRTVCMRVELYGCRWSDGILSYSMPQGDKRGNEWEFYDTAYDGHWNGEELRRGLGQLTDGRVGPDNFKMGYYENDKSQGWVGWRNDTRANRPIEIKFEFDTVREFTSVHIYCNNQFTKEVQVFSEAKVMFSVGGKKYKGEPITYTYMEDRIFENSRNVSIKLHHRVGRFVKLQLYFSAKWMMISEITFDSAPVTGNFTDEEENELGDDSPRDSPPQKDQVHVVTDDETNENVVSSVNANSGLKKYFGVVVGVLSIIVLVMIVAIVFIVIYQRRLKATAGHTVLPGADNRLNTAGKVSMDECDKAALYHEPCRFNMYAASGRESLDRYPGSPEYTDVKDLAYQEYAIPHHTNSDPYCSPQSTPSRGPPTLQTLLPKPPPVPPPPEQYYAATEICTAGYVPPPPPLSTPPTARVGNSGSNKMRRTPRHTPSPRKYMGP